MTYPTHRNCTYILPGSNIRYRSTEGPHWLRERTHGCWCSSWRMTKNGLRIWRHGAWRIPNVGELRFVKRPPPSS